MKKQINILDSTLRDGAQARDISFSVEDKIKILKELDHIGVQYVEAGNPGSNIKDREFFEKVKDLALINTKLAAFGSTRRKNSQVTEDENVASLLSANTKVVVIFGKAWDFHVTDIIQTTLDENLSMIEDTIKFFKSHNKEVIFDAEHFYDGYKHNPEYAMKALAIAEKAGADTLVLCDTNGGMFPDEIYDITQRVVEASQVEIGIHCHNDTGMAEANSMMAVKAGATHIQGTFLGIGERCGNANLSVIMANLQLKKGYACISEERMEKLTSSARYLAEVMNIGLDVKSPYVGLNAFAHKGGMHVDGVVKNPTSFEHISPDKIGNARSFLVSEVSGKNTIIRRIQKVAPEITKDSKEVKEIIEILKAKENEGYQFEGAASSFEMIIRKHLGKYKPFFDLEYYRIIEEDTGSNKALSSSAMIKIKVDEQEEITATEGNGPVNAIDKALKKALQVFYPTLKELYLTDYKVRILDSESTESKVRVLIDSTDGEDTWTTIGVSTNIVEASTLALTDAIEYKLIRDTIKKDN